MAYTVQLLPAAQRQLSRLDRPVQAALASALDGLAKDPRPPGVKKLKGGDAVWRIRVGDYRILYQILDRRLRVLVVSISHRGDIYR